MQTQHEMTMSFYNEFGDLNVYAKQYDTRRFIQFEFTEDIIPEDTSKFYAYIRGKYADGSLIPIVFIDSDNITKDYILFRIPSTLLEIPGQTVCDLVLCECPTIPHVKPDGTIDPDDEMQIISTHKFNIYVEAMATNSGSVSEHTKDEAAELTRLIIAAQAIVDAGEEAVDAEKIRNVNEFGGTATLKDGTTYTVEPQNSRVGAENIRKTNETSRIDAETLRVSAETQRQEAETRRESAEQSYLAQTKSYAIGDETARPGSSTDNAEYYYRQSREAVYNKGIMDLHIDDNGHLIYQRSEDLEDMRFSIQDNKNLILSIGEEPTPEPTKISPPTMTADLIYNGTSQSPTFTGYEEETVIFRGDIYGIDAGDYQTKCIPAEGYVWTDGSTDEEVYDWSIGKVDGNITLSSDEIELKNTTPSVIVNFTNATGEVTVSSSNTSVATASISGNSITISSVNNTIGDAVITVNVADSTNYLSTSSIITVTADFAKLVPWSEDSSTDEEIIKMVKAYYDDVFSLDQIKNVWHIGDTRKVNLSVMDGGTITNTEVSGVTNTLTAELHRSQTVEMVILDFEHDNLVTSINGKTKALVTLGQKDCLMDTECEAGTKYGSNNSEHGKINNDETNNGGWKGCARRTWCNTTYYNALPNYLKNIIKPVNKLTGKGNGNTSDFDTSQDKCWLPSQIEILGKSTGTVTGEGTQYSYYYRSSPMAPSNAVKLPLWNNGEVSDIWWSRSPISRADTAFSATNGYYNLNSSANDVSGLAPHCCI